MYAIGFLTDFGIMSFILAMPFYVFRVLDGGPRMSSAFGAAQGAAYAVVCLVSSGFVLRTKNGLNWAIAGMALSTVFICAFPFARNAWVCGALGTLGIGSLALVWPALHSYVGGEPDRVLRSRRMGGFNIAWSLGFALSPLFAGWLFERDYRLPFAVVFALNTTVLLLLRSLPHERDHHGRETAEALELHAASDRASERFLYASWVATMSANFLVQVTRTVFPRRIEDLVAAGELRFLWEPLSSPVLMRGAAEKFSWLAFSLSLFAAVVFIAMGRRQGWRHRAWLLFALQGGAAVSFWLLGNTRSLAVMALCFVVVGANSGFAFFSSVYYSVANWQQKHRRTAINEGAVGMGGAVSILFGWLAGKYGIEMPFHYTPVLMGGALLVQAVLLRMRRQI
jgi:MFS family permease